MAACISCLNLSLSMDGPQHARSSPVLHKHGGSSLYTRLISLFAQLVPLHMHAACSSLGMPVALACNLKNKNRLSFSLNSIDIETETFAPCSSLCGWRGKRQASLALAVENDTAWHGRRQGKQAGHGRQGAGRGSFGWLPCHPVCGLSLFSLPACLLSHLSSSSLHLHAIKHLPCPLHEKEKPGRHVQSSVSCVSQ